MNSWWGDKTRKGSLGFDLQCRLTLKSQKSGRQNHPKVSCGRAKDKNYLLGTRKFSHVSHKWPADFDLENGTRIRMKQEGTKLNRTFDSAMEGRGGVLAIRLVQSLRRIGALWSLIPRNRGIGKNLLTWDNGSGQILRVSRPPANQRSDGFANSCFPSMRPFIGSREMSFGKQALSVGVVLILSASVGLTAAFGAGVVATIYTAAKNTFQAAGGSTSHKLTQEEFKKAEPKVQLALDKLVEHGVIGGNEALVPVLKPDLSKEESVDADQFSLYFRAMAYEEEQLIQTIREKNLNRAQAAQLRQEQLNIAQLQAASANADRLASEARSRQESRADRNSTETERERYESQLAAQRAYLKALDAWELRWGRKSNDPNPVPNVIANPGSAPGATAVKGAGPPVVANPAALAPGSKPNIGIGSNPGNGTASNLGQIPSPKVGVGGGGSPPKSDPAKVIPKSDPVKATPKSDPPKATSKDDKDKATKK